MPKKGSSVVKQGRFAGVRKPHEAGVREQLQLQPQPALLPLGALGADARRLVGGVLESRVALAAEPALRHQQLLALGFQVAQQRAVVSMVDQRADRHVDDHIVRAGAGFEPTLARSPPGGAEVDLVRHVGKRRQLMAGAQVDRAAASAVAARRSSARHLLLAAKRDDAVAPLAGADADCVFVLKHGSVL
jgi:hypothetical protein